MVASGQGSPSKEGTPSGNLKTYEELKAMTGQERLVYMGSLSASDNKHVGDMYAARESDSYTHTPQRTDNLIVEPEPSPLNANQTVYHVYQLNSDGSKTDMHIGTHTPMSAMNRALGKASSVYQTPRAAAADRLFGRANNVRAQSKALRATMGQRGVDNTAIDNQDKTLKAEISKLVQRGNALLMSSMKEKR